MTSSSSVKDPLEHSTVNISIRTHSSYTVVNILITSSLLYLRAIVKRTGLPGASVERLQIIINRLLHVESRSNLNVISGEAFHDENVSMGSNQTLASELLYSKRFLSHVGI